MRTKSQQVRSFIMSIIFVALILMTSQAIYSQSVLTGFGGEIGGGYNQLFGRALLPPLKDYRSESTDFDLTPEARLNYKFQLSDKIACIMFVGYNRFGGYHDKTYFDQNGIGQVKSAIWFVALEIGLFPTYNLSDFSLGIGYKANRLFKATILSYFPNMPADYSDVTDGYRTWSHDAGLRVSYIFSHYSVSVESWFGISDLESNSEIFNIRQNQFRLLFGYTI
jgi:hypothetical protein